MTEKNSEFQQLVWDFYHEHGRHDLPWRLTEDPYRILVSEIMLQQTQVSRVIPKYNRWISTLPDFPSLAEASLSQVLSLWQGLGYNRRAKYLHQSAQKITTQHNECLPEDEDALRSLPGVGPYTASAVRAFAFNIPVTLVETNVRTVYLHHFFEDEEDVDEEAIQKMVSKTRDTKNPREWYWALMDYGSFLKKEHGNPNQRSKQYVKQSSFKGSNRQLRSRLLRFILNNQPVTRDLVESEIASTSDRQKSVVENLHDLEEEGLVQIDSDDRYRIPD